METPVWLWKENCTEPVLVGVFSQTQAMQGSFQYDNTYIQDGGNALDPHELKHLSARQPIVTPAHSREGLPGILADAGPDAWGRLILAQDLGYQPNALQALMHAADDGAGNLATGDIAAKPDPCHFDLGELTEAIDRRKEALQTNNVKLLKFISPDTALGGAKPKASVLIDGFPWIAKFPERGDPDNLPYFEVAAMRMADRLGINVAHVEVKPLSNGRSVLLAKRFDRAVEPGGLSRTGFASALTVMGSAAEKIGSERTYLRYASKLKTWIKDGYQEALVELWKRIVFNGLMANMDDHPRNHALMMKNGVWQLSPAYDIVPGYFKFTSVSLAMPFIQMSPGKLSSAVTAQHLTQSSLFFGIQPDQALAELLSMTDKILMEWSGVLAEINAPQEVAEQLAHIPEWVSYIRAEAASLTDKDIQAMIPRKRGSWRWAP